MLALDMAFEVAALPGSVRAMRTFVWPLAGVGPHVLLQSRLERESFAAKLTFVWSLAGVGPLVLLQNRILRKSFTAHLTFEWSLAGVDPLVHRQIRILRKSFTAHLTLEWSLAGVGPLVPLQMPFRERRMRAMSTAMYFLWCLLFPALGDAVLVLLCALRLFASPCCAATARPVNRRRSETVHTATPLRISVWFLTHSLCLGLLGIAHIPVCAAVCWSIAVRLRSG